MSQYTINIGAIPNDGTGDPLRTAFNETNLNFNQIFAAGPVLSNVQIANNTILTTNTNGNLVLAPNGTAVVQSNVSIVPNSANIRNLGSASRRWATVYTQYLNVSSGTSVNGNLTVDGNLIVMGNVVNMGNIVTDTLTIQLANTAANASSANGAGITVGANDNIATFLYSSFFNAWSSSVGFQTSGNILGNFVAPGGNSQVLYNRNGVIGASPSDFSYDEATETLYVTSGQFAGESDGSNGLFVGEPAFTELGSAVMGQFTGNVTNYTQINIQNISSNAAASADYIITANNGNDTSHFLDLGMTSSTWDGSQDNSLGNALVPGDGYLYVQDGNIAVAVKDTSQHVWYFDNTGNLTLPSNSANINYANGVSVLNGVGSAYGNSNVAVFLNNFGSNTISTTGNVYANTIFGRVAAGGNGQIQFNNNGNLSAASHALNYDNTANILYVITGSFSGDDRGTNGLFVGVPAFTELGSDVIGQFSANANAYSQLNVQNANIGPQSSGDYIVTADNGNDTTHFVDLGITGQNWDGTQDNSLGNALNPGDGYLYVQDGNLALAVKDGSQYVWKFDVDGNLTVPGNIIPDTNNVYSLGNATNQWSDLYVSNATIYMNNVPVSLTSGNVLTVNGNAVLQNDSNTSINTTGNITADYFFGTSLNGTSPSATVSLNAFSPDGNTVSIQAQGNTSTAVITTYANASATANTWTFGIDGTTTFPNNTILTSIDNDLIVTVQDDSNDDYALYNRVTDSGVTLGETSLQRNQFQVNFPNASKNFNFDSSGVLGLPGDIALNTQGGDISLYAIDDGTTGSAELKTVSYAGETLGSNVRVTQSAATISTNNAAHTWTFDNTGNLTVPGNTAVLTANATGGLGGNSISITAGASDAVTWNSNPGGNVNITGGYGSFADGSGGPGGQVNIAGGLSSDSVQGNVNITAPYINLNGIVNSTGNITGGNLISSNTIYGNVDVVLGNIANAAGTKTRIVTDTTFSYIQTGNGTVGSTGNIVFSPYSSPTQKVVIDTASGNLSATGNITGSNIFGNGSTLSNVAIQSEGSWTLTSGVNNVSFTVAGGQTYSMWVNGNIPNGIVVWNATVTLTNTNVPAIGQQFAWFYETGNALVLTAIPSQIIGTAGAISNASPVVANSNVFNFSITNNSGSDQTIYYGWTRLSQ